MCFENKLNNYKFFYIIKVNLYISDHVREHKVKHVIQSIYRVKLLCELNYICYENVLKFKAREPFEIFIKSNECCIEQVTSLCASQIVPLKLRTIYI